jgi:hypothetical protein
VWLAASAAASQPLPASKHGGHNNDCPPTTATLQTQQHSSPAGFQKQQQFSHKQLLTTMCLGMKVAPMATSSPCRVVTVVGVDKSLTFSLSNVILQAAN